MRAILDPSSEELDPKQVQYALDMPWMTCLGSEGMAIVSEPLYASEPPSPESSDLLCTAETAECTCPDFCERDHDTD